MKQNTAFDYIFMVLALVGVSMPIFWLGLMLVLQFSVNLGWLPAMGMGSIAKGVWDVISHMILPCFCLATIPAATFARITRSSMLETINSDYVKSLRARGVKESMIIWKHAFKNALPPILTVLGLQLAYCFSGAVLTESIFAWPGMGTLIVNAVNARDYSLIQGVVLFSAIAFVFINLVVDIIYMFINPRVSYEGGGSDLMADSKTASAQEALSEQSTLDMLKRERTANNAWHKLARNKMAVVGLVIVAVMVLLAVFAPLLAPQDPNAIDVTNSYLKPGSAGHLLGTDAYGRDLLSRIIYGARSRSSSLWVAQSWAPSWAFCWASLPATLAVSSTP